MSLISRVKSVWRNLAHRDRVERDLHDELDAAFELLVDEKIRAGIRPAEARRAATLELGRIDAIKDRVRDARSGARLEAVAQDVRGGLRLLRRDPLFTLVAALSLGIGIGANGAVFSFADALILRPLPVSDSGSVVTLSGATPSDPRSRISWPNYRDLRGQSASSAGLIAYSFTFVSFARGEDAAREMRMGMSVSDNFFDALGVRAATGRTFAHGEGVVQGRDAVVVLGYDFWKRALGGDESIVGTAVRINEIPFQVVGIAPERFTGIEPPLRPAMYVPISMTPRLQPARDNPLEDRRARIFDIKGRLKAGVSRAHAQAELTAIWGRLAQAYPDANGNATVTVLTQLEERVRQEPETAILLATLGALVVVVLLIACANVASLLLGRGLARSREIAVRLALGVGRTRLLQQLLTESLLLALLGCGVGLFFAYGGIRFLQTIQLPTELPIVLAPRLDGRVLVFSLLAGAGSAVLFGLAPAFASLKTQLVPALRSSPATPGRRQRAVGRNILVVSQIALAMVLLVATGMWVNGFRKLVVMNPGFRTQQLLMLWLDPSIVRYNAAQTRDFYRRLVDEVQGLAGVASAALSSSIPLDPPFSYFNLIPEGYQFPRGQDVASVSGAVVDERYFLTMNIELTRGRGFTSADRMDSAAVAIVNEEFAKVYWPDQDPIGKRLRLRDQDAPWIDVVGIARTGKYLFLGESPRPFVYLPFAQSDRTAMSLLVQAEYGDASQLAAPVRAVVQRLDVSQPAFNVRTFASYYEQRAIGVPLLILRIVATMGVLGLILALTGLYGLIAFSVTRRTQEIGIRMAVGAGRRDVLTMVLSQGFVLSLWGIVVGGIASVAVARLLAAGFLGVAEPNPATYVIVPAALTVLTMAASYLPARRASRVDPLRALRYE